MKGILTILLAIICFSTCFAQNEPREYVKIFSQTAGEEPNANPELWFDHIVARLDKKNQKNKSQFLKNLFFTVQNKKLKRYKSYASFNDMMVRGEYDCLTGTTLYAMLLAHYEIPFQIHETPYHINLTARIDNETYLLESTDPLTGFLKTDVEFIPSDIGFNELAGLLYYNKAIDFNNKENFQEAYIAVTHAEMMYPSEKINLDRQVIEQNLISSVVTAIADQ